MYSSIDAFENGLAFLMLPVLAGAVALFVGGTGVAISRLRELELSTVPEYFERRFDRRTRVLAGCMAALAGILNMALFPRMGATFLTYVAGFGGSDTETLVNLVTTVLVVLAVLYTVSGGMVAVIATDYLQFLVLGVGLAIALGSLWVHPGLGWDDVGSTLLKHRGPSSVDPLANPQYGWSWIWFHLAFFFLVAISWPPEASRVLTARDVRASQLTLVGSAPGLFTRLAVPALLAVVAVHYFASDASLRPFFFPQGLSGATAHRAAALPLFLGQIVPSGCLGLLVAGLFAAFMSTHDSYLLAWGAIITRDVVAPLRRKPLTETQEIRSVRLMVIAVGVFLVVWGLWYPFPASVWTYMAASATVYVSGAGVVILAGAYWSRASVFGARAGLLGGLVSLASLGMASLRERYGDWVSTSSIGLITIGVCGVLVVAGSLLFPDRATVDGPT